MALSEERNVYLDTAFQRLQQTREAEELRKVKDEYISHLRQCSNEVQAAANSIDEKIKHTTADILKESQDQQKKTLEETIKLFQNRAMQIEAVITKEGISHDERVSDAQKKLYSETDDIRKITEDISLRIQDTEEQSRRQQEEAKEAGEAEIKVIESKITKLGETDKKFGTELKGVQDRIEQMREEQSRVLESHRERDIRLADMQSSIFKLLNKIDDYYRGLLDATDRIKGVEKRLDASHGTVNERLSLVEESHRRSIEKLENSILNLTTELKSYKDDNRRFQEDTELQEVKVSTDLMDIKKLLLKMEKCYVQSTDALHLKTETNEMNLGKLEEILKRKVQTLQSEFENEHHELRFEFTEELAKLIEGIKALTNDDHSKVVEFRKETELRFVRLEEELSRQQKHTNTIISRLDGNSRQSSGEKKMLEGKVTTLQLTVDKRLKYIDAMLRFRALNEGRRVHAFKRAQANNAAEIRVLRRQIEQVVKDIRAINVSRVYVQTPIAAASFPPSITSATHQRELLGSETVPMLNSVDNVNLSDNGQIIASYLPQTNWNTLEKEMSTIGVKNGALCDIPPHDFISEYEIDKHEGHQFSHCAYLRGEIETTETNSSVDDMKMTE